MEIDFKSFFEKRWTYFKESLRYRILFSLVAILYFLSAIFAVLVKGISVIHSESILGWPSALWELIFFTTLFLWPFIAVHKHVWWFFGIFFLMTLPLQPLIKRDAYRSYCEYLIEYEGCTMVKGKSYEFYCGDNVYPADESEFIDTVYDCDILLNGNWFKGLFTPELESPTK